ncbi:MAG: hypothetical protein AAF570_26555 [Bacteroidota bacterium]
MKNLKTTRRLASVVLFAFLSFGLIHSQSPDTHIFEMTPLEIADDDVSKQVRDARQAYAAREKKLPPGFRHIESESEIAAIREAHRHGNAAFKRTFQLSEWFSWEDSTAINRMWELLDSGDPDQYEEALSALWSVTSIEPRDPAIADQMDTQRFQKCLGRLYKDDALAPHALTVAAWFDFEGWQTRMIPTARKRLGEDDDISWMLLTMGRDSLSLDFLDFYLELLEKFENDPKNEHEDEVNFIDNVLLPYLRSGTAEQKNRIRLAVKKFLRDGKMAADLRPY